jgi:hypothetical protein
MTRSLLICLALLVLWFTSLPQAAAAECGPASISFARPPEKAPSFAPETEVTVTGLTAKPVLLPVEKTNCAAPVATYEQFRADYEKTKLEADKLTFKLPKGSGCFGFAKDDTDAKAKKSTLQIKLEDCVKKPDIRIGADKSITSVDHVSSVSVSIQNDASEKATVTCGDLTPVDVPAKQPGTLTVPADKFKPGGLKCRVFDKDFVINVVPVDATADAKSSPAEPDKGKATDKAVNQCTTFQMSPQLDAESTKKMECGVVHGNVVKLCVDVLGHVVGPPVELREGQVALVQLVGLVVLQATVDLSVNFEPTIIVGQADFSTVKLKAALEWEIKGSKQAKLTRLGKLNISVARAAGTSRYIDPADGVNHDCNVPAGNASLSLDVHGRYYFSAGMMVAYTRLQERNFTRQTGDDGVMRIGQQDSAGIDYVLNVVAYPWGVDEERDFAALGILFGTSVASLGKRWYAGAELSSPIGFGVSGGAALSVVSKLDEPLVAGQPFNGDQIPTHNAAEPTWYVGVNLQAALFKKAFGAIFGSDDKKSGGGSQ